MIRDLNSRNGTFVNGVRVSAVTLKDGDSISTGKTHFQVKILNAENEDLVADSPSNGNVDTPCELSSDSQGSAAKFSPSKFDSALPSSNILDPEITEILQPSDHLPGLGASSTPESDEGPSSRLSNTIFKNARKKSGFDSKDFKRRDTPTEQSFYHDPPLAYESHETSSGLTYYCPGSQSISPSEVIPLIERGRNLYAMINHTQLPSAQQESFYRDCLARGAMPISDSQIIISRQDELPFDDIIRNAWGRDAVVLITSRKSKLEFVSQAYQIAADIRFPSEVLERLLNAEMPDLKSLLGNVSTLMLERDHGASWLVLKNDNEIRTWKTLGMPCPPVGA